MLIVETIAKIRRLFRNEHMSIREISRELRLSRKVVRKALRSDKTAFTYKRRRQPRPQLDSHVARLDALLAAEHAKPKRERLSYVRLFESQREEGYAQYCSFRSAELLRWGPVDEGHQRWPADPPDFRPAFG